jgi:hypothetical protein
MKGTLTWPYDDDSKKQYQIVLDIHYTLGLWELPSWLMKALPGYRFLMRLHSWCGTDSVIYCIPQEREVHEG